MKKFQNLLNRELIIQSSFCLSSSLVNSYPIFPKFPSISLQPSITVLPSSQRFSPSSAYFAKFRDVLRFSSGLHLTVYFSLALPTPTVSILARENFSHTEKSNDLIQSNDSFVPQKLCDICDSASIRISNSHYLTVMSSIYSHF